MTISASAARRLLGQLGIALALAGTGAAARADNGIGGWSALADWPLIPIHTMLLPNGTVMTYGSNGDGQQTGRFIYDVWDPRQGLGGGHLTLPNTTQTDLFCSAQIILPSDNKVFLAGGDVWNGTSTTGGSNDDTLIFDPATNTLIPSADMARARWYATLTTLPNGEIYIQGGRQRASQGGAQGVDLAEVRTKSGALRPLNGMSTAALNWWYPRNWVAPNGQIFGFAYRKMYTVDPTGVGSITMRGALPKDGPEGVTSSAVMYAPGKILRTGGGAFAAVGTQAGRSAAVLIDINGAKPKVTRAAPLPVPLQWHNATVVPDGRVVVTGGSALADQLVGVNDRAYIWSPTTGEWTQGARTSSGKARLYHSMAILLPDASILVGGGGAGGNMPQNNTNAEIYYPPYLYDGSGQFAPRPRITGGATALKYKGTQNIKVDNGAAIARVTLIKTGSVTHSFNMEQRFLELPFTVSGNVLKVKSPANANLAPPGRYMLFVLNAQGVPSVARLVSIAPKA
ncbi:MAG: galactose oxidase-like domain-containing protein [Geminicoccaceae bacterium]